MGCEACIYWNKRKEKKGKKCPNPKKKFKFCKKYIDFEENITDKLTVSLTSLKRKKEKKLPPIVYVGPKLCDIPNVDKINLSFHYKCECGNILHIIAPYIGNIPVRHICNGEIVKKRTDPINGFIQTRTFQCQRIIQYTFLLKKSENGFESKIIFKDLGKVKLEVVSSPKGNMVIEKLKEK